MRLPVFIRGHPCQSVAQLPLLPNICSTPRFASSSARSLPSCPACPLTHTHSTWCCAASASSLRHRSSFFTGFLSAVFQPRFFQLCTHSLMPCCTYFESDRKSTRLNSSHQKISYAVFCLK